MRKLRPLHRGRGIDGGITEDSPRADLVPITQLEWVEEEPSLHPNSGTRFGLQFVTETGTARPNGSFRDLIRSKARRKGQNQSESTQLAQKRSGSRSTDNAYTDLSRSNSTTPIPHGLVSPRTPQVILHGIEDNAIDPFYTLPISKIGATQFLINHYYSIFKPSYAPLFRKEDILNFAITDSALLHSLLVHSALNLRSVRQINPDPDMLYHQGETIRLVNDRLGDPEHRVATDATICTVANMTHLEILSGTLAGIKIHMDGLEALVKSRGGIQGLESHLLTRKVVMWTDIVASIALDTIPRFNLNDITAPSQTPDPSTYTPLGLRYKTEMSNLTGFLDLSEETITTYWDLRNLTALKDTICFTPSHSSTDFESSAHMIEYLERRCLSIIQGSAVRLSSFDLAVFPLFGNAALIHIMIFMRESPRRLPFARIISNRIRNILQTMELHVFQVQYPELMLWVVIMGGLGSVETENQIWFAGLLAEAARVVGIVGRKEIEMYVKEWLWTRLYEDEVGKGFWEDFAMCQGTQGEEVEVLRVTELWSISGEKIGGDDSDAPFEFAES